MRIITVCMGSSCFSRGNSINADLIQQFIDKNDLSDSVQVRGCLCESQCKNGPNIRIDGKIFTGVTPEGLSDLLTHELGLDT